MTVHFSNLSGLRIERDGTVKKQSMAAHIAELQQALRDIQNELRSLSGGGRGQAPATTINVDKRTPFRLAAPSQATTTSKVQVERSLRTGVKSRVSDDLVTRRELDDKTTQASTATGFMDLVTNQVVSSGNKDFGGISFQSTQYLTPGGTTYTTAIDLSGATVFQLKATGSNSNVTVHGFQAPSPNKNMFRILIWFPQIDTQNLILVNESTSVSAAERIQTFGGSTSATVGAGAFIMLYNTRVNRWQILARTA